MPNVINVDRGVHIRNHPKSGMNVYMYVDSPGVYLNNLGREVGETIAAEAGFDVKANGKERVKRERISRAMQAIENELAETGDETHKIVKEANGFKLVNIGLGRHHVYDPDGNQLSMIGMPREQAELLMAEMVKADEARVAKESKGNKAEKVLPVSKLSDKAKA